MVFSYFRKSDKVLDDILKGAEETIRNEGLKVVGAEDIFGGKGKVFFISYKEVIERIAEDDYNLLPFVPIALFVFEKDGKVVVGSGRGSLLGNVARTEDAFNKAQELEGKIKKLVNAVAQVEELKPLKIRLYSTTSCPYCKMEKAWLDANNVSYEQVFVDLNQEAGEEMVKKTGQMGVPVTEIIYEDSDPDYIVGFDKPQLEHILGIKS